MDTPNWLNNAIFYHIYPLGLTGAPSWNDPSLEKMDRLDTLIPWLDHIQSLGCSAIYLGPVFQSTKHGYDTIDYYQVDRRLGDNDTLTRFADSVHNKGMHLILDGVFNHVGRDFWAFKDVQTYGEKSAYRDWFSNLRFGSRSDHGDPFQYEGWHGHTSLVKLNLAHPHVREHLLDAVGMWMDRFQIDGLRLDAADCIDKDFLQALHRFTKSRRQDFWLMGEVVHGDYRDWVNPDTLDSVTNYELYKGLYASLKDKNYFEIAHGLQRQFTENGLYRELQLYNFVDNHDVDRVASKLGDPAWLYPLYILLFTMPGIPSIYYGSEWGITGVKEAWSDAQLRPALAFDQNSQRGPQKDLVDHIRKLSDIRKTEPALQSGRYQSLAIDHQQFAFLRQSGDERIIVILNSAAQADDLQLDLPMMNGSLVDLLNQTQTFDLHKGRVDLPIPPKWGRILKWIQ